MTAATIPGDVVAHVLGLESGSYLASLRAERPEIVRQTQATFLAIFEPDGDIGLSRTEREAVAIWVATLSRAAEVAAFHRSRLIALGTESEHLAPIGASVDELKLSVRERALLRHAEILTLRPATAEKLDTDALLNAEVEPAGIVALAQLVAFLSFEIRVIATLKVLDREAGS
ncbi:MAG: hypothetical protein WKF81_06940 [Thermomicrobiales bacterium]